MINAEDFIELTVCKYAEMEELYVSGSVWIRLDSITEIESPMENYIFPSKDDYREWNSRPYNMKQIEKSKYLSYVSRINTITQRGLGINGVTSDHYITLKSYNELMKRLNLPVKKIK